MTDFSIGKKIMADFSIKAISARVDFNDKLRIKLGLPYADSDIRMLLKVNAELTEATVVSDKEAGMVLVPREPTEKMVEASLEFTNAGRDTYLVMLTASEEES